MRYRSFERFTISSKPVSIDYIHAGVFVPVLSELDSAADNTRFMFSPLNQAPIRLRYWDEGAWVSELTVTPASSEPAEVDKAAAYPSEEIAEAVVKEGLVDNKSKKRKTDQDVAKPKKVRSFRFSRDELTCIDGAGTSSILEQSSRGIAWKPIKAHNRRGAKTC